MLILSSPKLQFLLQSCDSRAVKASASLIFSTVALGSLSIGGDLDQWVYLSANLGKQIHTTEIYFRALKWLLDVGALERDESYLAGSHTMSYRIDGNFKADICQMILSRPRLEERLGKVRDRRLPKDALHGSILDVYARRTTLGDAAADTIRDHPYDSFHQRLWYQWSFDTFGKQLNYTVSQETGRISYSGNQLPKILRPHLLIDGEQTLEVDVASSQPLLAATLYPEASSERDRYWDLCDSGEFYQTVGRMAGLDDIHVDDLKPLIFQEVFFGPRRGHPTYRLWQAFARRFPILAAQIESAKGNSRNAFALQLQRREADIMVQGVAAECVRRNIPLISIHDGVVVRVRDADEVEEIVREYWTASTLHTPRVKRKPAAEVGVSPDFS